MSRPVQAAILCGIGDEARALGRRLPPGVTVSRSAGRPEMAESQARDHIAQGARLLVSFGIAGGLDPDVAPGTLLLPTEIRDTHGAIPTERQGLRARLLHHAAARDIDCLAGTLWGSDTLIPDPDEKARLFAASGALAVDMESHRVARVAADAGVPCLVVRAVADPAARGLPLVTRQAIGPDGETRLPQVLMGVLRQPGQVPELLRLSRDYGRALTTLRRLAPALLDSMKAL